MLKKQANSSKRVDREQEMKPIIQIINDKKLRKLQKKDEPGYGF